jgi:hypothetical protein
MADAFVRALHDHDDLSLRPLPARAVALLAAVDPPARLAAHLRALQRIAEQADARLAYQSRYPN